MRFVIHGYPESANPALDVQDWYANRQWIPFKDGIRCSKVVESGTR